MDKSGLDSSALLFGCVGLAVGLSLAALVVSLARAGGAVLERKPRWQRARSIVMPLFGVAAVAIVIVWIAYQPQYRATAVLRISPASQTIVFPQARMNDGGQYQIIVNTEVTVVRSPMVLQRVLEDTDVQASQWLKENQGSSQSETIEKLLLALTVEPRPLTELIDISVTASKPSDAALLANTVVNQYRKLKEDFDRQNEAGIKEILTTQLVSLQDEISGMIKTRFNISALRLGTDTPDRLRSTMSERLFQLEDQLHAKQRDAELADWTRDRLEKAAASQPGGSPANPHLQTLGQLEMDRDRLQKEIAMLQKEHDDQQDKLKNAGDVALEIANLDEKTRQRRELYEAVRSRHEQLDMEEKAPARMRVVGMAMEPTRASDDRRSAVSLGILAAAGLLSLCLLVVRPAYLPRAVGSGDPPPAA